jgi:glutamate synthase (NADPH/NADH) large chain
VVAALLGAEEFGFATAPLVVSGCIMMRVCHLDTCPVGVATQNPELRARFTGRPEFVETFFEYIAEEVREQLAALGFRSIEEAVGQVDALDLDKAITHWKASGLDLTPILTVAPNPTGGTLHHSATQEHGLEKALDNELIARSLPAIDTGEQVRSTIAVRNVNRTVGTMLGHQVTQAHPQGLADGTIELTMTGAAGQSYGAFLPRGITLRLLGDANDYVGKGLSGGRVVVRPEPEASLVAEDNVIAGNVIGYGATSGELYLRGRVGERFCVRNSGATAVVEGVGDHGLEYMTGGTVAILGPTGRNLAAGMSGGVAYVLDLRPDRVNGELVELMPLRPDDEVTLRHLLERHLEETESAVARRLLDDWDEARHRFTLVLPAAYQRVLDVRAEAAAQDLDVDGTEVWNRIMEASRG